MPGFHWFGRAILTRTGGGNFQGPIATSSGATITATLTLSSGVDLPISTAPTTGTDLVLGSYHTLVTSSDGGYYAIDPPTAAGLTFNFQRNGTTATTSYLVPDATGVLIYTSSGSSGGRLVTVSGGAGFQLVALTTAQWMFTQKHGNVACTSST